MTEASLIKKAKEKLEKEWNKILAINQESFSISEFSRSELEKIRQILNSRIKSYHYVLPTQILSKLVDHQLDCRSLQSSFDSKGAFDARAIAHKVVVPFDKSNHNVLGGSNEPYVNNPLRFPAVIKEFRKQQKNQVD